MGFEEIEIAESERLIADYTNALIHKKDGDWYVPVPRKWLKAGSWTAEQALLLFSNIEPHSALFSVVEHYDPDCLVEIHNCIFLGQNEWTGGTCEIYSKNELEEELVRVKLQAQVFSSGLFKLIEHGQRKLAYECVIQHPTNSPGERYWELSTILERYCESNNLLNKLYFFWTKRNDGPLKFDKTERHPVSYFIEWMKTCDDCKAGVGWWGEAEKEGLLESLANMDESVSTRNSDQKRPGKTDSHSKAGDQDIQDELGQRKNGWNDIAIYLSKGIGSDISISTAKNLLEGRRYKGQNVKQGGNSPGGVWAWSKALDSVIDNPAGNFKKKKKQTMQ